MGKAKKGKRNANDGDVDSETENVDSVLINENQNKEKLKINNDDKKSKKNKNKHNDDDDIDEITRNIEDIDISKKKKGKTATKKLGSDDEADDIETSKKKSKTKKGKKQLSDDEDDLDTAPVKSNKSKAKGSFAVLEVEDDVDIKSDSDNEDSAQNKKSNKKNEPESKKDAGGKKGKKKKKRDDSDDEDLEKVLAELALEYSGGKKEVEPTPEPEEVQEVAEKKKEKKKKAVEPVEEPKIEIADDEEISGTVKTAAQKKKEKKEREKAKKMTDKQKVLGKKQESTESEPKASEDKPENEEPAEESTKEKKKKKGAKEEEKKGKTGKGPDKKTIAAMQEALKKMKEEEERLIREEEERIKREEEAEAARLEQERLEQERKEKRKQKEKERKERRKAEGKLLTPKQKLERARAQALLEERRKQLLLLQGGEGIPEETVEPKKPRLGTRIRPNKLKKESSQEKSEEQPKPEEESTNKEPERQTSQEAEVKKEDDVKDSWDAESSEEDEPESTKEEKKVESKVSSTIETKKGDDDENDETSSGSDDDSESGSDSDEDSADEHEKQSDAERKRAKALARIQKRREEAEKNKTLDDLRAAVVCVLGHVDTGKTKILDKLRRTNVQDGEAGGITQQIGATNVPIENIREQTKIVKGFADKEFKLPGLLIIDTPGHESFSNLRNRGSSLCDIAILVVDIMHGLEPQTIESINLLKQKRVPFVVALNKIDRLYDWETMNRRDVRDILKSQASHTQVEFDNRMKEVVLQFAEQGLNAALFYDNPDPKTYISLVPTSAITGEGMGNLLALIVEMCQTHLAKRLMYSAELQATVLEVKAIPGLGTTIDVILINGVLKEGDTMILAGTDGPVVTQIRSLLMPQPMRELRVKNAYIEYKEVRAAQGVKIAAKELEKAIAGLNLVVANHPDEVEVLREEVAREFKSALSSIKLQERGVFVQASTLGSLEALLDFLRSSKIPYAGIRIGPVVKKDVMKASIMLEHDSQYATILAFDVKIERDAQELADSLGVKIFQADIIYHLFDKFTAYREELKQRKRDEFKHIAVFPCKLRVLPQFVFNSRDPIVCGVMVEAGIVKEGTPICVPSQEFVELGIVTSIESNHKNVESARKGQEVCIKIEPIPGEAPKMFGRHFDETDMLVSKISRQSIDACKDYFRDDLIKTDWQLMVELKKMFQIL